ncbi:MAG: phosphatase PAP2 family protein [Chloroflexota bacterium]|nr:phosphatase PAP2 family protein [Chloroflexota bacterium]
MQTTDQLKRACVLWSLLLCALYLLLAILVHHRVFASIDLETTLFLQQIIPRAADLPFSILSLLGSVEITVAIFVVLVLLARPSIRVPSVLMFALVAVLELQGKTMIVQPGPPDELSRYIFWFGTPTGGIATPYSFPSGHSARACFLVALSIMLVAQSNASPRMKRSLTALLLIAGAAMFVSRVYLGDHWVTDVVGGALLGIGLCSFVFLTE